MNLLHSAFLPCFIAGAIFLSAAVLVFALGLMARNADDEFESDYRDLTEQMDWPEFEVRRVDHHAQRNHAVVCGKSSLPSRRASR